MSDSEIRILKRVEFRNKFLTTCLVYRGKILVFEKKIQSKTSTQTFCIVFLHIIENSYTLKYLYPRDNISRHTNLNFHSHFDKGFQCSFQSAVPIFVPVWTLYTQKLATSKSGTKTRAVFISNMYGYFEKKTVMFLKHIFSKKNYAHAP